jgi:ParB family chromosome partitioning protein
MLRLLGLPDAVRTMVRSGELSLGHARTLLGLSDRVRIAELAAAIVAEGLTVREVERRVRDAAPAKTRPARKKDAEAPKAVAVREIEAQLRRKMQTDVSVMSNSAGKGEVRIAFYSADDLERLLDLLLGPGREVL